MMHRGDFNRYYRGGARRQKCIFYSPLAARRASIFRQSKHISTWITWIAASSQREDGENAAKKSPRSFVAPAGARLSEARKVTARSLGRACPKWSRITRDFMESASSLFACICGELSAPYRQNDDYRPSWRDVPVVYLLAGRYTFLSEAALNFSPRFTSLSDRSARGAEASHHTGAVLME